MIRMQHVTKLYKNVIGVNDIDIDLQPGAYGLLGPNGSGKTTFLHLLTGQLKPTLGQVEVLGNDPWNNAAVMLRMGICPATDIYNRSVSGVRWVQYLLEMYGFKANRAKQRAEEVMEQVGMKEAMKRPMEEYSRGMLQRTKLAQSFAHDPQLLILDEPFNGLDPVGRHDMTQQIHAWIEQGKSLILASHVLHEVEAVTHSFMLICGGRILASGDAEEVRSLLADIPHEIQIRCDDPNKLAQLLLSQGVVDGLRFEENKSVISISTHQPKNLYTELPQWLQEANLRVDEIKSPDESLQALFDSLLRIHRGEIV